MTGTLFVVATPIGNLEDITLRALRILREANVIAAEDTRRTARLLAHHGIDTPTTSFHEHNTRTRVTQLMARLEAGDRVALVTDAGTPSISDPGVELVRACVERGVAINPIPGASAPLTAAIASGFPLDPWTMFGFPPRRLKERSEWLNALAAIPHTLSFFEAPHRIIRTLTELAKCCGERPIMIARELTKIHQEFIRGSAKAISEHTLTPKGEFTVVVGPTITEAISQLAISDESLFKKFCYVTNSGGVGRRSAIQEIAESHGLTAKNVYAAVERAKKLVL